MLTLPLEPTDDRANPSFKNAVSCKKWLSQVQFTNLHEAHSLVRTQLDAFNRIPIRALERLETLEQLRETVAALQTDYAKKLIAKKLPFSDEEFLIFTSLIHLWQGMVTGYQRCLQSFMEGDPQLSKHGVMICHRFLLYGSLQIIEHLRCGYEFDGALWQQLHALYSFTEGNGLQNEQINDVLHDSGQPTSCRTLYAKMLLICHARPAELSRAHLQLLDRWLTQWANVITLERRGVISKGDAPPLAVDLNSKKGLQNLTQLTQSDNLRYMAMVPLSKLLRVKIILLQQGQSPLHLELGSEFYGVDYLNFLNLLLHLWCEGSNARLAERHNVTTSAKLGSGFDLIYALIAKKPFEATLSATAAGTANPKLITTKGRPATTPSHPDLEDLETWSIENESILGARLLREEAWGERMGNNDLIALRTKEANAFMLGTVSWRSVNRSGHLHMGVQYLPGVAQAVILKQKNDVSSQKKTIYALLLPEMTALKIPPSLIIPRDIFQTHRIWELIQTDKEQSNIKMGFCVLSGADFERVSFTIE